ncbi:phage holin family protein [Phocaeicola plebeius]|uniref:phage holin family protein n=1 Tax=Phocaeicola plebeius TaxID=310297 RepID=UPI0020136107|nr:phage holin family protein [Phocaeicola plebeius]MCL1614538.1 phage holin family protein [Phocaeicola plebeius]
MEKYVGFITQDLRAGVAIIFVCLVLIVFACLLDMWTGIDAARANKEKICSRPLRKTGTKIVDYYRLVMFFILIDILGLCFPWYNLPYGAIIGTAGVLFVEGFSVVENLRKKKSHAADVADMAAKIVECLTPEEAQKIIKKIKEEKK